MAREEDDWLERADEAQSPSRDSHPPSAPPLEARSPPLPRASMRPTPTSQIHRGPRRTPPPVAEEEDDWLEWADEAQSAEKTLSPLRRDQWPDTPAASRRRGRRKHSEADLGMVGWGHPSDAEDLVGQADTPFPQLRDAPFYDPLAGDLALSARLDKLVALDPTSGLPLPDVPCEAATVQTGPALVEREEEGSPPSQPVLRGQVPMAVNRYLSSYQRDGVRFMWRHFAAKKGGLLADDMGLGKTVQVIAFLAAVFSKLGKVADGLVLTSRRRRHRESIAAACPTSLMSPGSSSDPNFPGPALICVPVCVLSNWASELKKWGKFEVKVIKSPVHEEYVEGVIASCMEGLVEVVLVGHSLLDRLNPHLTRVDWSVLVIDECHAFKEPSAKRTMALMRLVPCARMRLGLTGTPMSNHLMELFNLMNLLAPGCLGSHDAFQHTYMRPIKRARAANANEETIARGTERHERLAKVKAPYFLRRSKKVELKDMLPIKEQLVVFCHLSPLQVQLYRRLLQLPDFAAVRLSGEPCDCGRQGAIRGECCYTAPFHGSGEQQGQAVHSVANGSHRSLTSVFADSAFEIDPRAVIWRQMPSHSEGSLCERCPNCLIFPCIAKLQKVANHPALLQVNSRDPKAKRDAVKAFAEVAFTPELLEPLGGTYTRAENVLMTSQTEVCGKLRVLEDILTAFWAARPVEKCVVFSWSVQTLDIIQDLCITRGWPYLRFDGSTPQGRRQGLIDEFNDLTKSNFIFLCSTRAGGVGINLQSARKVVIFDANWNPAYDQQAQDRCYRIGQRKDVQVLRLVAKGTIEELVYMRQLYKSHISEETVDGTISNRIFHAVQDEENGELFGKSNIFSFDEAGHLQRHRIQPVHCEEDPAEVVEEEGEDEAAPLPGLEHLDARRGASLLHEVQNFVVHRAVAPTTRCSGETRRSTDGALRDMLARETCFDDAVLGRLPEDLASEPGGGGDAVPPPRQGAALHAAAAAAAAAAATVVVTQEPNQDNQGPVNALKGPHSSSPSLAAVHAPPEATAMDAPRSKPPQLSTDVARRRSSPGGDRGQKRPVEVLQPPPRKAPRTSPEGAVSQATTGPRSASASSSAAAPKFKIFIPAYLKPKE